MTKTDISQLTDRIVKDYQPQKIILFGSHATDTAGANSDIDLLIIKDTPDDYWTRIKKLIPLENTFASVDTFVLTPKEFAQAVSDKRRFLLNEILNKGKVIYEKT